MSVNIYDPTTEQLTTIATLGGSTIIVQDTYSLYENATVTASQGDYSRSAIVTDGYATITGFTETGTVTISVQGFTKTISVPNYSKYKTGVGVNPVGGFDYVDWLASISESASGYSSLADVLADEEMVRELFTRHASVDYLVSVSAATEIETIINNDYCAKWINLRDYALDTLYADSTIADLMDEADKYFYGEWTIIDDTTTPPTWGPKGNVPVMTSNTAPYGEASATNTGSGNAYNCFDNNPSTYWQQNSDNSTVVYKFTNPIRVIKFKISFVSTRFGIYKIQGSNDGSTYTDLTDTITATTADSVLAITQNIGYYIYYKFINMSHTANQTAINTLQFYGRELKVSVPKMTSNTAPYGEASGANMYNNANAPWRFFDGLQSNQDGGSWIGFNASTGYVIYDFKKKIVPKIYGIQGNADASLYSTKMLELYGSNNLETWEILGNDSTIVNVNNGWVFANADISTYKSFRYIMFKNTQTMQVGYANGQIYGLDYSEYDWDTDNPRHYIYDHGVELETLDKAKGSTTSSLPQIQSIGEIKTMADGTDGYSNYSSVGKQLDITPYSLLRVKIGREMAFVHTQDLVFAIAVATSFPPSNGTYTDSTWIGYSGVSGSNVDNPNTLSCDVSTISGVNWIICGSFYWSGRMGTLKELWLE